MTPLKDEVTGKQLTPGQVKMKTSKKYRYIVAAIIALAVFTDILGTSLTMPALASLCAYAEGGVVDQIKAVVPPGPILDQELKKNISPYAFKDPAPPFKFSMAMNFILSLGQLGSALGSLFFGRMADKIGAKKPMMIMLFAGLIGYGMIFVAGKVVKSYWLFGAGIIWNNFFGNCLGVASVYLGSMYDAKERDMLVPPVLSMALLGSSIGALVVMPFTLDPPNGENYFDSFWIAISLTIFAFLLVTFVVADGGSADNDKVEAKTPAYAFRILTITVIASALDSAGDEGTRMARGTILSNVFPEWSTVAKQNILLLALICLMVVGLTLHSFASQYLNLGVLGVFGCFMTLVTQICLMMELDVGPYLIFWHFGKLFGFFSTFCSSIIVQRIAPVELLGSWNGRNDALTNLSSAIAPLIFSNVYDGFENIRGQEMLACTAAVSFLAMCAYMPLTTMLPKPPPRKQVELDLDKMDSMSDIEYRMLPMEHIDIHSFTRLNQDKVPRSITWGKYDDEKDKLPDMQLQIVSDLKYLTQAMTAMMVDRKKLAEYGTEYLKKYDAVTPKLDRNIAKADMGAWLADYLDDAGYIQWERNSKLYKAMFMAAFPPISPIDGEKPNLADMTPDEFEETVGEWLRVLDGHLNNEQRRLKAKFSEGSVLNLIRRR